jgi:hypothetical protein
MKWSAIVLLLSLVITLFLPIPGYAFLDKDPSREWYACQSDAECVKAFDCRDVAINKNYIDPFTKSFRGCDGSMRPNPDATARCVNDTCIIVIPDKEK